MRPLVSRTHRGRCKQRDGGQASPGSPRALCAPSLTWPSSQGSQVVATAVQPPGQRAWTCPLWPGRGWVCHTRRRCSQGHGGTTVRQDVRSFGLPHFTRKLYVKHLKMVTVVRVTLPWGSGRKGSFCRTRGALSARWRRCPPVF